MYGAEGSHIMQPLPNFFYSLEILLAGGRFYSLYFVITRNLVDLVIDQCNGNIV